MISKMYINYVCIWKDLDKLGLHNLLANESSAVNGCRQNESSNR